VSYREEFGRLFSWEDHHRLLVSRLALVLSLTALVDLCGTVVIYFAERHAAGTEITSVGDAIFFTTVQLLTVSSQLKNPLSATGRVTDVVLELWAVLVVAGSAGAMADFFQVARTKRTKA
jgi:hypothetical protein